MVPGVPKMTPAHCFLLALEALKWPSEKHQSSEKCIYFQTSLFVPYDAPRPLKFAIYFCIGSCFEQSGAQLNMGPSDSINDQTVKVVVSYHIVFKQVKVCTTLASVESTG